MFRNQPFLFAITPDDVIKQIEKEGSRFVIHWLSDLEDRGEVLENFHWLYLAESVVANIFHEQLNLDAAKSSILIYEKIAKDGNSSALLSSAYIRIRIFESVSVNELELFFQPEAVVDLLRKQLIISSIDAQTMLENSPLEIENMRLLREYKNWINVLVRLEEVTCTEYSEFKEWKKIMHLLP